MWTVIFFLSNRNQAIFVCVFIRCNTIVIKNDLLTKKKYLLIKCSPNKWEWWAGFFLLGVKTIKISTKVVFFPLLKGKALKVETKGTRTMVYPDLFDLWYFFVLIYLHLTGYKMISNMKTYWKKWQNNILMPTLAFTFNSQIWKLPFVKFKKKIDTFLDFIKNQFTSFFFHLHIFNSKSLVTKPL